MTAKEFIRKELENFIEKFPQTRVRYEFHELANAHYIEILPNEIYSLNADYLLWESEMWDKYMDMYPEEGICFISDDAIVGIKEAEFTLPGENYYIVPTVKSELSIELEQNVYIHFTPKLIPEVNTYIQNIHNIHNSDSHPYFGTHEKYIQTNCQNYPLAA